MSAALGFSSRTQMTVCYQSSIQATSRCRGIPAVSRAFWAEENTRDSIFDALKRRETFATSGTRILVRFFAGWDFPSTLDDDEDLVALGYRNGVTMGSDLSQAAGESPRFIVWAMKGVDSANLYKAQIIKGWYEEDGTKERVYDVACSDGHSPDPATSKCPETTATVDLSNCKRKRRQWLG